MKSTGQNITEFAIILALIAIAAIAALTIFGENVHTMFSRSHKKAQTYKPFEWEGNKNKIISKNNNNTGSNKNNENSKIVNGIEVFEHPDGSVSFSVENQDIQLSSSMINDLNTVFQSVGSDGLTDEVMKAIMILVQDHANEYPPGEVPLEIAFGDGSRTQDNHIIQGKAEINMTTLRVGNHIIIVQHDQENLFGKSGQIHGINGYIKSNPAGISSFDGKIMSYDSELNGKNYSGEIQQMLGLHLQGQYENTFKKEDWDFDFPPLNKFQKI